MPVPRITRFVLIVLVATTLPSAVARASIACPPPDAALSGSPVATNGGIPELFRADPDGFVTVTALIADPSDRNAPVHQDLNDTVPIGDLPSGTRAGIWTHNWASAPEITTLGIWIVQGEQRVRLPIAAIENLGGDLSEMQGELTARALNDALHHAFTTAPFLWNMLLVGPDGAMYIPIVGGLVYVLAFIIASYFLTVYPAPIGWESFPPVYVWTMVQNALGQQVWGGQVLRRSGAYEFAQDQDGYGGRGCTMTRIDKVVRDADSATAYAGVWILEEAIGRCDGFCIEPTATPNQTERFDARQRFTAGVQAAGTDVPLVIVEQTEHKQGEQTFMLYPDYQRETIALGISANGVFVPLIGARFEAWHAAPPERQRRLISIGVFDPLGTYHPVFGSRMRFERQASDVWAFLIAFDGIGSRQTGDAMIDLGVFDPNETFIPLLGTEYSDDFPEHRFEYRARIAVGPYVGETWHPAFAVTYDGEQPLTSWALANLANDARGMGEWIIAAGPYNPAIGFRPVVGVRYVDGEREPGASNVETYRVGIFPADYATFVPLAGANYASDRTSFAWTVTYAGADANAPGAPSAASRIPSRARIDVGVETPVTGFVPIAGARMIPGNPQRTDAGVWTPLGYVPLVHVCQSPGSNNEQFVAGGGVGGEGGPIDQPLAALRYDGALSPSAGACPAV